MQRHRPPGTPPAGTAGERRPCADEARRRRRRDLQL